MTTMQEAPLSFTTKVNGDLLTVRGTTVDEFMDRVQELAADPRLTDALTELQSISGVAVAKTMLGATEIAAPAAPAAAPAAAGAPEVVKNQYGNVFTYNHPEAPDLPDGRGKYVFKEWSDKSGKQRKAFVDPIKGPKPFPPGATEAPTKWA
jgi:hypothetical protein